MARLVINGKPFDLSDKPVTIGRGTENVIVLEDKESSRNHCRVEKDGDSFKVVDLLSRNGTKINGTTINVQKLKDGDKIQIGKTTIAFELTVRQEAARQETAQKPVPDHVRKPAKSGTSDQITVTMRNGEGESSEQKLLRYIIMGGGAFIFLILLIVVIQTLLSGRPQTPEAPKTPSGGGTSRPTLPATLTEEDKAVREIRSLFNANPTDFETIARRVDEFKRLFPQTNYLQDLDELKRKSADARQTADQNALNDVTAEVDGHLKANRYAEAVKLLTTYLRNRKDSPQRKDAETRRNIIISNGNKYFNDESSRIQGLIQQKKYTEANSAWTMLLNHLGAGSLDEFKTQCRIISQEQEKLTELQRRGK